MQRSPRRIPYTQHGAALMLLLVILLGVAMGVMNFVTHLDLERHREQTTQQRLAAAREALIGYATSRGRLPRPAISALNGQESDLPCSGDADCTGFIPWVTLGIEGTDGWWHLLRYSVTPELTEERVHRDVVPNKTVSRRMPSGELRYLVGQDECSVALLCSPAIVFSTGKLNFGVGEQGIVQANSPYVNASLDELANVSATRNFIYRERSQNPALPGGSFDDLVSWVEAAQLLVRMDRASQLR